MSKLGSWSLLLVALLDLALGPAPESAGGCTPLTLASRFPLGIAGLVRLGRTGCEGDAQRNAGPACRYACRITEPPAGQRRLNENVVSQYLARLAPLGSNQQYYILPRLQGG